MNTPMNMDQERSRPAISGSPERLTHSEHMHKAQHDIRSAMHVVTGMSEVLSMSDGVAGRDREVAATLLRNAEAALALMETMFETLGETSAQDNARAQSRHPFQRAGAKPGQVPAVENPTTRPRALVVEDDESNAFVMSSFLETMQYDIDFATTGEEAVEKFSTGHYDVIMMDVQMRGMDGLEATRRIRDIEDSKNLFPTPILGCTGNASKDDAFFCTRAGMTDVLSKPFSRKDLENKLLCALPLFGKKMC